MNTPLLVEDINKFGYVVAVLLLTAHVGRACIFRNTIIIIIILDTDTTALHSNGTSILLASCARTLATRLLFYAFANTCARGARTHYLF